MRNFGGALNGVELDNDVLLGLIASVPEDADAWFKLVTEEMAEDIVNEFDTSPAGREYPRGGGQVHVASQPGFPPNTDSGDLAGAIIAEDSGDLTRIISTKSIPYAGYLEMGTENMAARPFFTPVLEMWGNGGKMEQRARELGIIKE